MIAFDLCNAPLEGTNLIEAGAGTGKTYAIAGLFLRLIVECDFEVDQILVVTYTKAATEELKTRIRQRLNQAKSAYGTGRCEEPLLASLLERTADSGRAVRRLQSALLNFDRAAIFTIHGFCQRLLQNFAFETGQLFQSELMADMLPLVQETADDFWRRRVSLAPPEIARYVLDRLKGPEQLSALYQHARFPDIRILPNREKPDLSTLDPWREVAAQVLEGWPSVRANIIQLLLSPGLNARYYGKCEEVAGQAGTSQRSHYVHALAAALDRWPGQYPLINHFERFCADFIAKASKKNHAVPRHPFFDLCQTALALHQNMERELDAYLGYLKSRFLMQAGQRLAQKKDRLNVLSFDDLLIFVHQALNRGHGNRTAREMQKYYRAALVDEFQDTDPLQNDIFKRLFAAGAPVFFLIGDPKQAIYSFRGADLYAYLEASRDVARKSTLTRNWRSTPRLVEAVNAVFDRHPQPFGLEAIDYLDATAAMADSEERQPPLTLWYLLPTSEKVVSKPFSQQEAIPRIAAAVAHEIATMLNTQDGGPSAAPEQIAVLTRNHSQANLIKEALARRRVPAVLYSAGSVFETREAQELAMVLQAAAVPSDSGAVRSALATDLLGAKASDFLSDEKHAAHWEQRWERFASYHQAWINEDFYTMFSRLMHQEGVKQRLLPLMDGERRITNLLHLAELLHQAATSRRMGPEALIGWFDIQRGQASSGEETQQLRLESDAHAVRILTIHKSKGLQFDVVFCPFTWSGAYLSSEALTFHDPELDNRLTLSLGPHPDPRHAHQGLLEVLAENLRLLYVALTRARKRCYWVWGRLNHTDLSAPAYLLHGRGTAANASEWIDRGKHTMASLTDADLLADLEALAAGAPQAIELAPLPAAVSQILVSSPSQPPKRQKMRCRSLQRPLDKLWRMASFSSLTAGGHADQEDRPEHEPDDFEDASSAENDRSGLMDFPRGVTAGLFFHDLLEHWDFTCRDDGQRRELVKEMLSAHGYEEMWVPIVEQLLKDLGAVHLPDAVTGGFCLNQISGCDRINEMAFHFPMTRLRGGQVKHLIASHAGLHPLESLPPLHGYMKGFIDMVVRHNRRYYLVDWKSNYLGQRTEDYVPQRLERAMAEANYTLQYAIYVCALDKYLRSRLPGYDYSRHFGGVYYIFLRGIRAGQDHTGGIFHARPEPGFVKAMNAVFGSGDEDRSQ